MRLLLLYSFFFVFVFNTTPATGEETGDEIFVFNAPASNIVKGENLQQILFESNKPYFEDQEKEVLPALTRAINSGWYDIVEVQTTYKAGYLTSAEIIYNDDLLKWNGNKICLMLIKSDRHSIDQKAAQLKPKLERATTYEYYYYPYGVAMVNLIYMSGHLDAFELYYWCRK